MSSSKTAIVIGATGLVGREVVKLLLEDERYGKVKVFVRRPIGLSDPKLEHHIIDFNNPVTWEKLISADELYSCLGTTIKAAGSKDAQYKVDYSYQFQIAIAAAEYGIPNYALVSSFGADSDSRFFYSRMKGELDRDISKLKFSKICIIRPSLLLGNRPEKRIMENISAVLWKIFAPFIPALKKYKPIPAQTVARAMINALNQDFEGLRIYELIEIFELAALYTRIRS